MPSDKHGRHKKGHKTRAVPQNERTDQPTKPSNLRSTITNTPDPLIYGFATIMCIFGITFLIIGSVHSKNCNLEKMIPIWLLVLGLIFVSGGCWIFFLVMRLKRDPFRIIKFIEKMVSVILLVIFIIWVIIGNVWVYKGWAEPPDFGHWWYDNGCDKSTFFLSFIAIITLDAILGLLLIGFCFWGVTKVIVRE